MTQATTSPVTTALQTADWRRRVFAIYAEVRRRGAQDPADAHAFWVAARDDLFANHPASPILPEDKPGFTGLTVTPYDPAWRFTAPVVPAEPGPDGAPRRLDVPTATDGVIPFELLGTVELSGLGTLDVWRLASYGGGLFVPIKDTLAGVPGGTYGGGRYLLDTIKGSWLGHTGEAGYDDGVGDLVLDLNFAYNPSCAYDPAWVCPLAQPGNTLDQEVPVGERTPATSAL
ncbi:DUF1684 domain-containing protein [Promicromonospora thailandica]|uniref:DUF1684 domain-containing protein n=1 Tax=Promicromonospora thailandica TaxID=765201 RepID=A0A9X2G407_9MICO|nr:DUF1684 domain-containing protein [Promicromonospora thailandica]MCP2266680.1 hypothetical protein [Promicromonospora thailandica]BFF17235.1 DUF1684 domain-containing protein [Promicromonospora thailandica]